MIVCSVATLKVALATKRRDIQFFDVRTPTEYQAGHIAGVRNVPLGTGWPPLEVYRHGTVYLVCHSGRRSSRAATELEALGAVNVVVVEGGMAAWLAAGQPVIPEAP